MPKPVHRLEDQPSAARAALTAQRAAEALRADRLRELAAELKTHAIACDGIIAERLYDLSEDVFRTAAAVEHQTSNPRLTFTGPGAGAVELVVDGTTFEVQVNGEQLTLPYQEFTLLYTLLAHRGRALTRSQLTQAAWKRDLYRGDRTVDIHIRRLRARLGPAAYIATVRGVGYRFG